jgi:ribosome-binding protein aMBF1 (putative translation factor)
MEALVKALEDYQGAVRDERESHGWEAEEYYKGQIIEKRVALEAAFNRLLVVEVTAIIKAIGIPLVKEDH